MELSMDKIILIRVTNVTMKEDSSSRATYYGIGLLCLIPGFPLQHAEEKKGRANFSGDKLLDRSRFPRGKKTSTRETGL